MFRDAISTAITHYFRENAHTASTRQLEWDAFKTVIRGTAISWRAGVRSSIVKRLAEVEDCMGRLEQEAVTSEAHKKELQEAQITHAELLEELRTVDYRLYIQKQHAEADRAGPLLARIIKDMPVSTPVTQINTPDGDIARTQLAINNAFKQYYTDLYKAPEECGEEAYDSFFEELQFQQLEEIPQGRAGKAHNTGGDMCSDQGAPTQQSPGHRWLTSRVLCSVLGPDSASPAEFVSGIYRHRITSFHNTAGLGGIPAQARARQQRNSRLPTTLSIKHGL